jgi:hypothetical protein
MARPKVREIKPALDTQLIEKLLLTEKGLPVNAGTRTPRKRAETHAPVGVPSKGGPETVAD